MDSMTLREQLKDKKRIVVKVGSIIPDSSGDRACRIYQAGKAGPRADGSS